MCFKNCLSIFLFVVIFHDVSFAQSVEPEFSWSPYFTGSALATIGVIDGNNEGFVAATASFVPTEFINDNGELECHILYQFKQGVFSSTGDINNGGVNCPLLSGARPIRVIEAFGADICIGGDFTQLGGQDGLNYFACYSPTLGWYQPNGIGNGPNNSVYSIEISLTGTHLYVGGLFTSVNSIDGGLSANRIVKTDGLTWEPLYSDMSQTSNGVNATVNSILPTASFLFVGSGASIMSWNSSVPEWLTRGTHNGGLTGVADMVSFGSLLTASTKGATQVSGDPAGSISDYDIGSEQWSEKGTSLGINTQFAQLAFGLGPLYATGDFSSVDVDAKGVAIFVNNDWQAVPQAAMLGDINAGTILDMQQGADEFCMLTQGGVPADSEIYWQRAICYDGNNWRGISNSPKSNVVYSLSKFQGKIIHGGDFVNIGDQKSNFIGQLNGNKWKAISQLTWTGSGVGNVSHMQEYNGELYATGLFNFANGVSVNQIAKWDGNNWTPAIPGFFANSAPMVVWDNKLIISGVLNGLNSVVSWDGSQLVKLEGLFGASDLVIYRGDLVASSDSDVFMYSNGSWQNILSNIPNIRTLAASGNDLYVGGIFSGACSGEQFVQANNIMRWDGNTCHALGTGVENSGAPFLSVSDVVVVDNHVFVTGQFDTAGSLPANNLAYWDGDSWSPMGNGLIGSFGSRLLLDGNDLYIAGAFRQAGNVMANNFAKVEVILDRIFVNGFE